MSETEISAKIPKSKKKVYIIIITQKTNQHTGSGVGLFPWAKHKTIPSSSSSFREWNRILAAILDFVEEAEKRKKNDWANSLWPICILQIFRNNPSRDV